MTHKTVKNKMIEVQEKFDLLQLSLSKSQFPNNKID